MAKTEHYYIQFEPECYYHVFNRAIDRKNLFASASNYTFFLRQYDKYLSPVVSTLSYALMGNHFHLGIRIRALPDLTTFRKLSNLDPIRFSTPHSLIAHQFQRFFQSYAMAFNKQQGRIGTLFQTPFKRCAVDPDNLPRLVLYHHLNPQWHGLVSDFTLYPWTSYSSYLSARPSKLLRTEVLELFGGRATFLQQHQSLQKDMDNEKWVIED